MLTEPDTISLFCLLMLYIFSFYSITPLCPYHVCSNPIMTISSKDVNANLSGKYGATYFFLARFARSVFKTLINNKMYCTIKHKHRILY